MIPNKILLGKSSGIIEASFDEVSALLLNIKSGQVSGSNIPFVLQGQNMPEGTVTLDIRGGPDKFTVFSTGQYEGRLLYLELNKKAGLIALYGGYWYRGEYQLIQHPKGCLITLSIYNIAPGVTKIFVPFLKEYRAIVKEFRVKSSSAAFDLFLQSIGNRFGCAAYSMISN